ncbi:OmpA family protein [Cellulophaga sp. Z1A5H]|uniref:OmpA family protein n=1 Tax=Cellulophaga sp. Z1A5H TaxID=2687291 RepID=UPI0013FE26F0|nr:OmpA family protein [Cellulophaga sp. Z1A5H]
MSNGIEKLGLVNPDDKNIIWGGGKKFPSYIKVKANCEIAILAYKNSKSKGLRPKWIAKPREKRPFSSQHKNDYSGDIMGAKVEARFCGPQIYHVEAFIGEPINKEPNRILIQGYAPEKITKAEWRKSKTGASLKTKPNKFGDDIWLHLETEGLNGCRLNIMVYNDQIGDDQHVGNYVAKCYGGEINLLIKDTYKWRAGTGYLRTDNEEYYIKVKILGKSYLIYNLQGQKRIAEFVVFKNDITKTTTEKSTSTLPAKVDQSEINLERYEPCRFKTISIKDDLNEIVLFDEGNLKIEETSKTKFAISEYIYFEFEKYDLTPSAKEVLNNISTFLLDNPFVPCTLGAHCDIRGSHEYNDPLSNQRAISAVNYLVQKGVSSTRITAKGYGKRRLYIKGENISESQHKMNRRVTIQFNVYGGDAESIKLSAIAPDINLKKDFLLKVDNYKVKACLRRGFKQKHDDLVYVVESIQGVKSFPNHYPNDNVNHKIYSDSTKFKLIPLDFILPHKVTPNKFLYYINSCRYYSNEKKATVQLDVYPDIKWDFHVFGKLKNPLGVKWSGLDTKGVEEMRSVSGKIAAQKRWKKTEAAFGFALNANWNKTGVDTYDENFAVGYTYENSFKKLYNLFTSLKGISSTIAEFTGGKAKKIASKKVGVKIEVTPPNVSLGAEWQLARASDYGKVNVKIGTLIKIYLKAEPIIGLDITFDLLGLVVKGASVATTGNTAAADLFLMIRDWAERGYDSERVSVSFKMWIDAILSSSINGSLDGEFNTESKGDTQIAFMMNSKISVELSVGVELTGKVVIIKTGVKNGKATGVTGEATGKITASSGKLGIVLGGRVKFEQNVGLFLEPILLLQECTATAVILIEVKFTYKKHSGDWTPLNKKWNKRFWKETDLLEEIFDDKQKYEIINLKS